MKYQLNWTRPTPLMVSIAALYALGMMPRDIHHRLRCSGQYVSATLSALRSYWSADTWREAARMEWEASAGEMQ